MRIRLGAALWMVALFAACADRTDESRPTAGSWSAVESPVSVDPALEARIEDLLSRMTLEEKVGQLIQADVRRVTADDVRSYNLGSVLNGGGGFPNEEKYSTVQDWLDLADMVYDASVDTSDGGVGIPIIWGVDAVHGHNNVIGATLFPHNVGLGAANNPELIRRIGEATAREVRVTGHDWNFGPTVAVPRDGRWGRAYEGYSEDPEIVSAYAEAMVRGLQGDPGTAEFLDEHHVIATAKHFLADGGTESGKDQGDALVSEAELRQIHGAPYVTALQAGVQSVMASFSSWHGVKMHANRDLLTGVLKETMGFDGLLVGDWNGHGQVPGCSNGSCAASINAGLDMFMVPDDWKELYDNTLEQARSGEIPSARVDDAVRRILRVKVRAGVFDRGRPSDRQYAGDETVIGSPEHRAVARQAVRESLVLLKNNGAVLPLSPGQRVLVAGDGADDIGKQSGGWTLTWQGTGNQNSDFPGATSIWDGVRAAVESASGAALLSPDGSFDHGGPPDVALVVFGEDPYAEFQGDREDVDYLREGKAELELMRELKAAGVTVVSVFITGRPLWVTPELNASDAFVVAWLPGSEGGGIADVIFADAGGAARYDFAGRLSFSWPKTPGQAVLNRGDPDYDPLFAYGYGLSYGDEVIVPDFSEDREGRPLPAGRLTFFEGGPVAPWRLMVQGPEGEDLEAAVGRTTSRGGEIVVTAQDRRVQEDARQLEWNGSGVGRVYLAGTTETDVGRESNAGLALAFDVRIDRAPVDPVALVVAHGTPGEETHVDLTPVIGTLPEGEWTTVRLGLRCLEAAGLDMQRVTVPWGLETAGSLSLAVSDVRLVTAEDGPIICLNESIP